MFKFSTKISRKQNFYKNVPEKLIWQWNIHQNIFDKKTIDAIEDMNKYSTKVYSTVFKNLTIREIILLYTWQQPFRLSNIW